MNLGKRGQLLVGKTCQDSVWWPDSWAPHENVSLEKLSHGEVQRHVLGAVLAELTPVSSSTQIPVPAFDLPLMSWWCRWAYTVWCSSQTQCPHRQESDLSGS